MSRRENGEAVKKRPRLVVSGETPQNNTYALVGNTSMQAEAF